LKLNPNRNAPILETVSFRFRKTVKIAPGVRINFSKGSPSLSFGGRGLTENFGRRGIRQTVGLPGTGLSYSTRIGHHSRRRRSHHTRHVASILFLVGIVFWACGSDQGAVLVILAALTFALV
jgi:hypothetical protein